MRLILVAVLGAIASPAFAQPGTTSPGPARDNAYGVTTGSAMSSPSRGPTSGSATSTARLPAPGARSQGARAGRAVGSTYGGSPANAGAATAANTTGPR